MPGPEAADTPAAPEAWPSLRAYLREQERLYLRATQALGGDRTEQARRAGLPVRTYYWHLRRHDLEPGPELATDALTAEVLTSGVAETVARLVRENEARLRAAAAAERAELLSTLAALPEVA